MAKGWGNYDDAVEYVLELYQERGGSDLDVLNALTSSFTTQDPMTGYGLYLFPSEALRIIQDVKDTNGQE